MVASALLLELEENRPSPFLGPVLPSHLCEAETEAAFFEIDHLPFEPNEVTAAYDLVTDVELGLSGHVVPPVALDLLW